jgi:hypothetical protein
MVRILSFALLTLVALLLLLAHPQARAEKDDKEKGFVSLFDGKTLKGWTISAKSGHSSASKNKSGGKWVVEEGAIVGTQDIKGNGGIIITDKEYGNFEIALEMKNDFGPDSGLFLRSNDKGQAYQCMIDYYPNGNLMGIYGEGLGGFTSRNYSFGKKPSEIVADKRSKFPLPITPEKWPEFWKHGEWNELRARITGNPPEITTWIKGVKFMEWKADKKHRPDKGHLALQVHGGGDHTKEFVRYRNIRMKELE